MSATPPASDAAHAHERRERTVRALGWVLSQSVAARALSFIVLAVLGRLLGPNDFGVVALAATFTAFLEVWVAQGFSDFIVQARTLEPEHLDTAFWVNVGLGGTLALGLFACSPLLADAFDAPALADVSAWLALSLLLRSLNTVQSAMLSREFRYRTLALRSTIASLVGGGIGIATALLGFGAMSLVAQTLSAELLATITLWTASGYRPGLRVSVRHLRELSNFGGNMLGAGLLAFGSRRLDALAIGYWLGPAAVGAYAIAQRTLQTLAALLNKSGDSIAFNNLSRLQHAPDERRETFYSATEFTALVSFPVYAGLAVVAPEIISSVFGAHWAGTANVLRILALAGIVYAPSYINAAALKAAGKPSAVLRIHVTLAVVYLALLAVALRFGVVGVAATYVLSIAAVQPLELYLVRRELGLSYARYFAAVRPIAVAAVLMSALVWLARAWLSPRVPPVAVLATCILFGALVYVCALRALAPSLLTRSLNAAKLVVAKRRNKVDAIAVT